MRESESHRLDILKRQTTARRDGSVIGIGNAIAQFGGDGPNSSDATAQHRPTDCVTSGQLVVGDKCKELRKVIVHRDPVENPPGSLKLPIFKTLSADEFSNIIELLIDQLLV